MDYKDFDYKLTGMWEEVLTMYGIDIPKWRGKNTINHPCPCCGGDDRAHWRETEGRLSLYCRNCTGDTMKSAEDVIMEVCGISFSQLVNDLSDFVNHKEPQDIKKAQKRVASKPKRNLPGNHKQDHDKSEEFLNNQKCVTRHVIFNRFSVQYPYDIKANDNSVFFDIRNENDVIVNVFAVFADKNNQIKTKYLAGGISYGAWHTIKRCEQRSPEGIVYFISAINGIHHWYKTGQEVRIVFDEMNLLYMVSCGMIDIKDGNTHIHDMIVDSLPVR